MDIRTVLKGFGSEEADAWVRAGYWLPSEDEAEDLVRELALGNTFFVLPNLVPKRDLPLKLAAAAIVHFVTSVVSPRVVVFHWSQRYLAFLAAYCKNGLVQWRGDNKGRLVVRVNHCEKLTFNFANGNPGEIHFANRSCPSFEGALTLLVGLEGLYPGTQIARRLLERPEGCRVVGITRRATPELVEALQALGTHISDGAVAGDVVARGLHDPPAGAGGQAGGRERSGSA